MARISLTIKNLHARIGNKKILNGVTLEINPGKVQVIMGPNGSGKSTLALAVAGHPGYTVSGEIKLEGKNLSGLKPEARVKQGLLLAFQNPIAIPGVSLSSLLKIAYREIHPEDKISIVDLHKKIASLAEKLSVSKEMLHRGINDGFSGGERKKCEMLQLLVLKPKYAIFDEIDTGLDVDALKTVALGIDELVKQGIGILLITHYQRILRYLGYDKVYVMMAGKIAKVGDKRLVNMIEEKGYASIN